MSTKKSNVYLNNNKINEKLEIFLFTLNRLFKHKEDVSNQYVCTNELGKIWVSYIFHYSTRIITSTHPK